MIVIATKEEERKALDKIKKIVEGLGEGSYLAAAFEGVYEVAERNIEEDAAYNLLSEAETIKADAESKYAAAAELAQSARKEMLKADEIKKKFTMDKPYWEEVHKLLDKAAYQLFDKLGY